MVSQHDHSSHLWHMTAIFLGFVEQYHVICAQATCYRLDLCKSRIKRVRTEIDHEQKEHYVRVHYRSNNKKLNVYSVCAHSEHSFFRTNNKPTPTRPWRTQEQPMTLIVHFSLMLRCTTNTRTVRTV